MSTAFRRYEILLPLRFNDGQVVPDDLIVQSLLELRAQFGAVSCESRAIHGNWQSQDRVFRDESVRLFVDVPDTPASRQFFVDFKKKIQTRFEQLDIWLTTYPIEVI